MVLTIKIQNFQQKKWYFIDSDSRGNYSYKNKIKFLTNSLESSLSDYFDAYILVTWNIIVRRRNSANTEDIALNAATQVVFKNCA